MTMGGQGYQPWLLQPFLTPHKCARLSPTPPPQRSAWNSTSDTVVMKSPELRGSGQTCCSDALQARTDKNIKTMTAKYERWTKPQRMAGGRRRRGRRISGGSKRWQSAKMYTLNNSVPQNPASLSLVMHIHFLEVHNKKKGVTYSQS